MSKAKKSPPKKKILVPKSEKPISSEPIPESRKVGRPTIYKPEYCQLLIDHMKSGLSFECFGAAAGVSRDAVYRWANDIPEFAEAKRQAKDEGRLFWERKGVEGLIGNRENVFNSTVWIFNMKNRFPQEWRDNKEVNLTKNVKHDLDQVSKDRIIDFLKKKD